MAGLYIHIPFCKQACYYCDFHFSTNHSYKNQMVEAIAREIVLQNDYLNGEPLDTIYFGGGTPSLLTGNDLNKILDAIHKNFSVNKYPEISLEANPDDLTFNKLVELHTLGINRLSIGIQSFHDETLASLNRVHTSNDAINCLKNARLTGFNNISIDLIFAIPGRTQEILENDLRIALDHYPEHLSAYGLTIEEKTVFGNWNKKGKLVQVDEEEAARQFDSLIFTLESHGYEHYEISNFCRDQKYSRHNTSYWKNINYLGIGPGAHSYNGKSRQYNISNNAKYMKFIERGSVPCKVDFLSKTDIANEYLLTSLRTCWGCNLDELQRLSGYDLRVSQEKVINQLEKDDMVRFVGNILYLTRKGKFLADSIIMQLFIA